MQVTRPHESTSGSIRRRPHDPAGAGILTILLMVALTAGLPAHAAEAAPRAAVPDSAAVNEAVRLIKQVFAREYEDLLNEPQPLIRKLCDVADKTEDPARKYAALLEAEAAAVSGALHEQAFDLIDRRAKEFDCDGLSRRLELLSQWIPAKSKATPRMLDEVYEMAYSTTAKALASDRFDAGESAARMALGIANQMQSLAKSKKDDDAMAEADEKQRSTQRLIDVIERMAELHAEYVAASQRLEDDPDDPALHGLVGQYLCLCAWDWNKGLASLARGDVPRLSKLAADELEARAQGSSARKAVFRLADAWWGAAEEEQHAGQALLIKAHAGQLYHAVVKDISDPLDKELAMQRIASTEMVTTKILGRPAIEAEPSIAWLRERPHNPLPPGTPQEIDVLGEPAAAGRPAKRVIRTTAVEGGADGKNFTDEEPPEGAELIGFYVFTTASWVDAIQAVYRLQDGTLHYGEKHGGNSGKRKIFKINAGERLTNISGSFSENITSLQFHTDQRSSDLFGSETGQGTFD
ncbi:MAG: jacalin-like lectin, partial [Planctomycetota bacterium]